MKLVYGFGSQSLDGLAIFSDHLDDFAVNVGNVTNIGNIGIGCDFSLAMGKQNGIYRWTWKGNKPFHFSECSVAWSTRLVWDQKIGGSNPLTLTNFPLHDNIGAYWIGSVKLVSV